MLTFIYDADIQFWNIFWYTYMFPFHILSPGFVEVGGFEGMRFQYERSIPNTTLMGNDSCGFPREDYMNLFRDPVNSDLPWPGIIGLTINSIWYWCADQVRFAEKPLKG